MDGVVDINGDVEMINGKEKKFKKDKKFKIEVVEEDDDEDFDFDLDDFDNVLKKLFEKDFECFVEVVGIFVKKFKCKYECGDIELNFDGILVVYSKKEFKKVCKVEEKVVVIFEKKKK